MTNDDGLPIETTSWYKELDRLCQELGENPNLLISDISIEALHEEFVVGTFNSSEVTAWTPRYSFKSILINDHEHIVYVPRNPTRTH